VGLRADLDAVVMRIIIKLSWQQAKVIHNHAKATTRNIGQGEDMNRKYKRLKLGGGQAYDRSSN
jgi:hypothetical protein